MPFEYFRPASPNIEYETDGAFSGAVEAGASASRSRPQGTPVDVLYLNIAAVDVPGQEDTGSAPRQTCTARTMLTVSLVAAYADGSEVGKETNVP